MGGFTYAYFISPKGEIIYCGVKHITAIINSPEKFGMDTWFLEYIYDFYKEKLGQEGKAREQIILKLIAEGWIRIRKYGDNFWTVNVDKLTRLVKQRLQKWAKQMLKGKDGIKEYDKNIPIKIDQKNKKVLTSDITSIANSDSFVTEDKDVELVWKTLNELEDLPLYEWAKVSKIKRVLNESSLSRLWKHMKDHDAGTITAFRDKEYDNNEKVVKSYTKKDNKARNKLLLVKLMSKYSITSVKGAYIENYGSPEAQEVGESVFFVVDIKDGGNLEKDLQKLGQEFNQDSILFIPKGENKGILIGTKKDEFSNKFAYPNFGKKIILSNAVWGKNDEFMTKIKGRPFLFTEELTEIKKPRGFFTNWGLHYLSKMDDWKDIVE